MAEETIDGYTTLNIPNDYISIQDALDHLEDKVIIKGVDIRVADGEYTINTPIISRVKQGDKLTIRGNETDCAKCVLKINNQQSQDGFLFENGHGIAWLNGFTLIGQDGFISKGQWQSDSYGAGIRVISTNVKLGSQIVINKMYYGIRAMYGAFVSNEQKPQSSLQGGGIKVSYAGDVAFHAYAATLIVSCAEAYDVAHEAEGLGFGFCAEAGGFISCEYAIANGNRRAGYYALTNGSVWAHGSAASFNTYGVLAWGGQIECNSLGNYITQISLNNTGISATYNGFIGANRALCEKNDIGVLSENHGLIDITNITSQYNNYDGIKCDNFGSVTGFNVTCSHNGGDGFHCANGSDMNLTNAQSSNNSGQGYYAARMSKIMVNGLNGQDNLAGFCSPTQSSQNQASGNYDSYVFDI